jgi:hypothetical protein
MSASRFAVKAIRLPTRPRPVEKEVKVEEKEPVKEEKPVKGKSFCKYCHDNKFPEEVFTSHFFSFKVVLVILRKSKQQ